MKKLANFNESEMKTFAEEALNNDELFVITGGGPGEADDELLPDPPPPPEQRRLKKNGKNISGLSQRCLYEI